MNYLYHLKIQIGDRKYEELIFDDADKEIVKLGRTLTGLKSVSNNDEKKNFIFNVFHKQIETHSNLVNEIFKSTPESKVDNSDTNPLSNQITREIESKEPANKQKTSTAAESIEVDDSLKKSDF